MQERLVKQPQPPDASKTAGIIIIVKNMFLKSVIGTSPNIIHIDTLWSTFLYPQ